MRDRVILMVGLYDTLDIFTYELKKEFEKIGLEVMIFNSQDMEGSMIKLSEFIKEPVKAVVTFNNLGFNMELIKVRIYGNSYRFHVLIFLWIIRLYIRRHWIMRQLMLLLYVPIGII